MNAFASQLTLPCVRHLFWCLFSPELAQVKNTAPFRLKLNSDIKRWFLALEKNPQPLYDYLAHHNCRLLGSYFEYLWQFFFQFNPHWQLLANNIQVVADKQTLGELDIIAKYQQAEAVHLELAVKFYLQHPDHDGTQSRHWLGPQCRDRLDIKLTKLHDKQLPFLRHPATLHTLVKRKLPIPTTQGLVLKGYLFHQWQQVHALPQEVNKHCLMGQWLHQGQVEQLVAGHQHWLIIEKPQWLGIVKSSGQALPSTLTANQVTTLTQNHFSQSPHKHVLMLLKVIKEDRDLIEAQRYLIVNDDWPTR